MLTLAEISSKLRYDYSRLGSWELVAQEYGLTKSLVWQVALKGHEPSKKHIRRKLGLPHMKPAPACPDCGDVPLKKTCGCRRNGTASARKRTPPIRIGEATDEQLAAVMAMSPAERLEKLLE